MVVVGWVTVNRQPRKKIVSWFARCCGYYKNGEYENVSMPLYLKIIQSFFVLIIVGLAGICVHLYFQQIDVQERQLVELAHSLVPRNNNGELLEIAASNLKREQQMRINQQIDPLAQVLQSHYNEIQDLRSDMLDIHQMQDFLNDYGNQFVSSDFDRGSRILLNANLTTLPMGSGKQGDYYSSTIFDISPIKNLLGGTKGKDALIHSLIDHSVDNTQYWDAKSCFFTVKTNQIVQIKRLQIMIKNVFNKDCIPEVVRLEGIDYDERETYWEGDPIQINKWIVTDNFVENGAHVTVSHDSTIYTFECKNILCEVSFKYFRIAFGNNSSDRICVSKVRLFSPSLVKTTGYKTD